MDDETPNTVVIAPDILAGGDTATTTLDSHGELRTARAIHVQMIESCGIGGYTRIDRAGSSRANIVEQFMYTCVPIFPMGDHVCTRGDISTYHATRTIAYRPP